MTLNPRIDFLKRNNYFETKGVFWSSGVGDCDVAYIGCDPAHLDPKPVAALLQVISTLVITMSQWVQKLVQKQVMSYHVPKFVH